MGVPDFQSLMRPLLALAAENDELRVRDAVDLLADRLGLTEEQRAERVRSGTKTCLYDRMQWAKTYLTKAGLLAITGRGRFAITPRGREILAANPLRVDNMTLAAFPEFVDFVNHPKSDEDAAGSEGGPAPATSGCAGTELTPEEILRDAHRQVDAALAAELLDRIRAASPAFFEGSDCHTAAGNGLWRFPRRRRSRDRAQRR